MCIKDVAILYLYRYIIFSTWRLLHEFKPVNFASSLCFSCNVGFQFPEFLAFSHWVLLPLRFALIGTSRKALEAIAAVVTLDRGDGQAHTHTYKSGHSEGNKNGKNAGRSKIIAVIAVLLILLMGCFLVQGQIQRSGFYVSAESPKLRTARVAKVDFVRLWTWRRCSPEPWRNFEIPRRCLHCYTLNTGRIQTCFLGTIVVFTKVKLLSLSANYKVHSQHSLHLFVQLICNHTARLMSAIERPLKLQAF